MRRRWGSLGGRLGMAVVLAGAVVVFLGWNGAASYDRVPAQFPYLISGGVAGLALVVVGAALLVIDASRRDRAALQASVEDLRRVLEDLAAAQSVHARSASAGPVDGTVVAGRSSYHRPGCRLVEGRDGLRAITEDDARSRALTPCRICRPDTPGSAPPAPGPAS